MPPIVTRPDFYLEWIRRAFSGRLALAEFAAGLLALIAVPVGLWIWPHQGGAMNWLPLGLFLAAFVATVLFGLAAAPYWIYGEISRERDALRAALDNRDARRQAISALWELRAAGVEKRNRTVTVAQMPAWLHEYEAWRTNVLARAAVVSYGLESWLTTLDRMDPPPAMSQSANDEHQQKRWVMSEILSRLQQFLQAEMLNKDIARSKV